MHIGSPCASLSPEEEIGDGATLHDIEPFGPHFAHTRRIGAGGLDYDTFSADDVIVHDPGTDVRRG